LLDDQSAQLIDDRGGLFLVQRASSEGSNNPTLHVDPPHRRAGGSLQAAVFGRDPQPPSIEELVGEVDDRGMAAMVIPQDDDPIRCDA
jgi:hypothetical protein